MQSPVRPGLRYLAEGGQETELMYGHGFELPQFALFPLLDVAVRHRMGVMLGGLDYRASPDWAGLLGLDATALADYQHRSISFLREVAEPYRDRLPHMLVSGVIGPQGDAYERNEAVTASSAEAYHG
ncbi:MAG: homocysteine S-methyltransferase, partial [Sphingomonadales bacterium]|nr:homocysteine S-methyltransferase [Sphingomonadales bacterium]